MPVVLSFFAGEMGMPGGQVIFFITIFYELMLFILG